MTSLTNCLIIIYLIILLIGMAPLLNVKVILLKYKLDHAKDLLITFLCIYRGLAMSYKISPLPLFAISPCTTLPTVQCVPDKH